VHREPRRWASVALNVLTSLPHAILRLSGAIAGRQIQRERYDYAGQLAESSHPDQVIVNTRLFIHNELLHKSDAAEHSSRPGL
jgi:hypothetical protein